MTSITTWSTNIANDNIKSTAAIAGSKLDLTSSTGRISQSTSVTSDAPVFTSGQTWDNIATAFSAWRLTVTNTNSASASRLIDLRVGSTIIASISRVGQLMLAPQAYASGPTTLMEGAWFNVASATMTDNMTAASGTAPRFMAYAFQRPALAAANSSVTTTNATTVFIASAPVAGDNMTLTNRYALWVDQGDVRIGGSIFASGAATIDGRLDTKGALWVQGATTLTDDLAVNGGDLTSTATTFNLLNATVTTLNLGGAVTVGTMGANGSGYINHRNQLLLGHTTTTSLAANDIGLKYSSALRSLNNAGNDNYPLVRLMTLGAVTNVAVLGSTSAVNGWGPASIALGGGSAPTLGTIGGSGPASAGQAAWLRVIESDGTSAFIAIWR